MDILKREYNIMTEAVREILDLSYEAFRDTELNADRKTESLEPVIDQLNDTLHNRHIIRLQRGKCSIDAGLVWSDIVTKLERVADHCSNISGCVLDAAELTMNIHRNQRLLRSSGENYTEALQELRKKYELKKSAERDSLHVTALSWCRILAEL